MARHPPLLDSKEISVRQAMAGPHRLLCVAAIMKEMDKMLRIYQAFRPIRPAGMEWKMCLIIQVVAPILGGCSVSLR